MTEQSDFESEIDFLFNQSTQAICYTDSNGIFLKVNELYCKLFSLYRNELVGQDITILFPNLDVQSKKKLIQDYKDFFKEEKNDLRDRLNDFSKKYG